MAIGIITVKMGSYGLNDPNVIRKIPAIVKGDWAWHLTVEKIGYGNGCTVTHVPSGFYVIANTDFINARVALEEFANIKPRWNGKGKWPKTFEATMRKITKKY